MEAGGGAGVACRLTRLHAAAAAALLLALLLTAARSGWRRPPATRSAADAAACRHLAAAVALPGGCVGELAPGTASFNCCTGDKGGACQACSPEVIAHLQCPSPRHMLLQPLPGCADVLAAPLPAALWQPGQRRAAACSLPWAAIANGSWEAPAPAETAPALPEVLFRLAAPDSSGSSSSKRRASRTGTSGSGNDGGPTPAPACDPQQRLRGLGAAEVAPRCLWAAGLDRVVVSGDSTVRQSLFNRLVSLLRQRGATIDGGGLQHGHYSLHLWRDAVPLTDASHPGLSTDPAAPGSGGGGGEAAGGELFATDHLWYSPTGEAGPASRQACCCAVWGGSQADRGVHRLGGLSARLGAVTSVRRSPRTAPPARPRQPTTCPASGASSCWPPACSACWP